MTPGLALSLCLIFVAALFVTELRRPTPASRALWLPTIWMMYSGSRPLAYWFDPALVSSPQVDYAAGSAIDRVFLSVLIVTGLAVLSRRSGSWSAILASNRALLIFFAYMGLSILWSDFPAVSFKRWVRTLGDLVMVLLVLTETDSLDALKTIIRRTAFLLLPVSVVLIKYFREIGVAYTYDGLQTMWVGVSTHKNDLGYLAMVCGLYFVNSLVTTWGSKKVVVDGFFLVMTLWLLGGSSSSTSKTSGLCSVLGLALLMALRLSAKGLIYRFFVAWLLVLVPVAYLSLYGSVFEPAVNAMGRDATLTGRTDIWAAVLETGVRDPIFGRGYGSFWIGNLANDVWNQSNIYDPIQQSHNGYIDIYIELGLVGVTLLLCIIYAAYRHTRRTFAVNFEYGSLKLVFLAVILVHNITESSFARPTHLLWFCLLLVSAAAPCVPAPARASKARRLRPSTPLRRDLPHIMAKSVPAADRGKID